MKFDDMKRETLFTKMFSPVKGGDVDKGTRLNSGSCLPPIDENKTTSTADGQGRRNDREVYQSTNSIELR